MRRSSRGLYAWHHNYSGWTRTALPGPGMSITAAVAGTSSGLWAAEASQTGTGLALLHLAHGTWHRIPLPARMQHGYLATVIPDGPDSALAAGTVPNHHHGTTPAVGRWNGHRWTITTLPVPPAADDLMTSLVNDGPHGLLATVASLGTAAPPSLRQNHAGRWTQIHLTASHPVTPLALAAIPGTTAIWATARSNGRILLALLTRNRSQQAAPGATARHGSDSDQAKRRRAGRTQIRQYESLAAVKSIKFIGIPNRRSARIRLSERRHCLRTQ